MPSALRRKDSTMMMRCERGDGDEDGRRQAEHRHQHHQLDDPSRRRAAFAEIEAHRLGQGRMRREKGQSEPGEQGKGAARHSCDPSTGVAKFGSIGRGAVIPLSTSSALSGPSRTRCSV